MALDVSAKLTEYRDPMWRLHNLYYIIDKDGRRVKFQPNQAQLKYLREATHEDIILKARQLGFTTLMCIVGLDEALWIDDQSVGIIAHKLQDAGQIFESKVRYPYSQLAEEIRAAKPARNDRAGELRFQNNSRISVSTSFRSGTLTRLHISEFGKICAKKPQDAREIVTGAFPAVGRNPKTIESTAEGQEGYFYQFADEAMRGEGTFKMHFFPWHSDKGYTYDPGKVRFNREHALYFDGLKHEHGIDLTEEQRAWWVKQEMTLGGDMKRENPSTPEEAFEQAIEGAYFASQMAHADKFGHIGAFPYDPKYPVNTFWDLGRNDFNTIWLHQQVGQRNRFIGYYENSGEHLSHYVQWLVDWKRDRNAQWGDHYWPHDGKREDLFLENGRLGEAEKYGLRPIIVDRASNKVEAIEAARQVFASCDFDKEGCDLGIKRLRHYRKEWDDMREVWKDRPRHDDNSHGADGFMTFATGFQPDDLDTFEPEPEVYGRNEATGY